MKGKGKASAPDPAASAAKVNVRAALNQSDVASTTTSKGKEPERPTMESAEASPASFHSSTESSNRVPSSPEIDLQEVMELYTQAMHVIHAWLAWRGFGSPGNISQPTSVLLYRAERAREEAERTGNADFVPGEREMLALEVAIEVQTKIFEFWEAGRARSSEVEVEMQESYGRYV